MKIHVSGRIYEGLMIGGYTGILMIDIEWMEMIKDE